MLHSLARLPFRRAEVCANAHDQRQALGIPESLVRYSVGIENVEDLQGDLAQALAALPTAVATGA